jgi:hypothetical protein
VELVRGNRRFELPATVEVPEIAAGKIHPTIIPLGLKL